MTRTLLNKYRATCNGCLRPVEAGAGRYEVLGTRFNSHTRVRCLECVGAGRVDGPRAMKGQLNGDLGDLLSDDPMDFVVFHDGQWKVALTYEQMECLIGMAKDQYRARDQ